MPPLALVLVIALAALAAGCGGFETERPTETVEIEAPEDAERAPDEDDVDVEAAEERCPGAGDEPTRGTRGDAAEVTLCLVNHEREQKGRDPLSDNPELARAGRRKARDMIEQDYFDHVGPDGRDVRDWVQETDYLTPGAGFTLAENLAIATDGAADPASIVHGWMNSRSHRRNILSKDLRDSGIGIAMGVPERDGDGGATYAHMFGTRN